MASVKSVQLLHQRANVNIDDGIASMATYPRVHMFSLDLSDHSGSLRSGSMGVSLTDFPINISVGLAAKRDNISPDFTQDIAPLLDKMRYKLKSPSLFWDVKIDVPHLVGRHTGLGTTTQIMGATALCAAKAAGADFAYIDLFSFGIGYASALGLSLLFNPGFIIENGYKVSNQEAGGCKMYPEKYDVYQIPAGSVLSLANVQWVLLLAIPKETQSLSGKVEDEFWDKVLPGSLDSSYKIAYNVLEKIIPGLICDDYAEFLSGIREVTNTGTKPLEESLQNPKTKEVLDVLRKKYGFAAISSLGPTIYAFSDETPSPAVLEELGSAHNDFVFYAIKLNEVK